MTDISLQKTAKTARRGRGRPFQKGQSGNPVGRPRGSTNRATRAAELVLDGETAALTRKGNRARSRRRDGIGSALRSPRSAIIFCAAPSA